MKITIRMEHDKNHFIKKQFATIEEAQEYLRYAGVAKNKRLIHVWLNNIDGGDAVEGGAK
jgi:hypothetical protein